MYIEKLIRIEIRDYGLFKAIEASNQGYARDFKSNGESNNRITCRAHDFKLLLKEAFDYYQDILNKIHELELDFNRSENRG